MKKWKRYVATAFVFCILWHIWWLLIFGRGSSLVIRGKILDPHTFVRASSNQTYVAADQGWQAMKVKKQMVIAGINFTETIWIENLNHRGDGLRWERWECEKDKTYTFALSKNSDLSKWCQTDVFRITNMQPNKSFTFH